MTPQEHLEAEVEREKRLVKAIADVLQAKLEEIRPISPKEHEEHHEFISELKESKEQQKKWRLLIIEKVIGSGALALVVFVAGWLLGICFRARRTGNGQNGDGRRGVRGSGC